jgi:hypothetical protein
MNKYLGKTTKIKYVYENYYELEIDNELYSWEDWMLFKVKEKNN